MMDHTNLMKGSVHVENLMNLAVKESNYFPCIVCGAQILRKADLRVHLENMHGTSNRTHYCDVCGAVCKNKAALRFHIYRWHKLGRERKRRSRYDDLNILTS